MFFEAYVAWPATSQFYRGRQLDNDGGSGDGDIDINDYLDEDDPLFG
jgi:hypothetical protein